jgi:hypothetical protein
MANAKRVPSAPRRTASKTRNLHETPPPKGDLPNPEALIIRLCMTYAQNVNALGGIFRADPTDSKYAEPAADPLYRNMQRALLECSAIAATTLFAINAKARIVPMILKDEGFNHCSDEARAFYESFAADVKAFTEKLIDEERTAAHLSNKEAA